MVVILLGKDIDGERVIFFFLSRVILLLPLIRTKRYTSKGFVAIQVFEALSRRLFARLWVHSAFGLVSHVCWSNCPYMAHT